MTESAPNPISATLPARMPRVIPMTASSDVQAMLKYSTRRPARVQRTRSGPAALITALGIRVSRILQLSGHSALENFDAEQTELCSVFQSKKLASFIYRLAHGHESTDQIGG